MATAIRVLLRSNVNNLGSGGEVVRVRPGYARNFLLPRGLAVPATAANLAQIQEFERLAKRRHQDELEQAQAVAQKLAAVSVRIERVVGEENRMYGSVTSRDIEEAYGHAGVQIDRKKIQLREPIKQLGSFEVPIRLHADVTVNLRVEVAKKS